MGMKVGLVFGGRSVEHVVSVRSAKTVLEGLEKAGHHVVALGIAENGAWLPPDVGMRVLRSSDKALPASTENTRASVRHLATADIDVAFPIVHGTYGEDGTLQGLFEMLDVAYVGCGVLASSVAMDKLQSKRLFEAAGLPVVPYVAVTRNNVDDVVARTQQFAEPLFVKPSVGGSSVGCKLVKKRADLVDAVKFALQFDDVALVEKGVKAREIEVAILGAPGSLRASAVGEIVPGGEFYDYEDKYLKDDAKLLAPAPLDAATTKRVQDLGVHAMTAIGGAGLARVDFFLVDDNSSTPEASAELVGGRRPVRDGDQGRHKLYLNEINTLPGFTSVSMYPRLWGLAGVPLPELADTLVKLGVDRQKSKARLDDSLRAFVASVKA